MDLQPDHSRIEMNRQRMRELGVDVVVCAAPSNVLLFSGYWPIAGNTLAIATNDSTTLLLPTDEAPLAQRSWADALQTYELGSLKHLRSLVEVIQPPLMELLSKLISGGGRIGFEAGPRVQPAPYAAMSSFGESMSDLLHACVPGAQLRAADAMLERLRSIKTDQEIAKIRGRAGSRNVPSSGPSKSSDPAQAKRTLRRWSERN